MTKETALRDRAYLDWLRDQPCLLTGVRARPNDAIDPMHIGTRGKGIKSSDSEAIPVRHSLHLLGHQKGEITMLRENAPDWVIRAAFRALARELYQDYLKENT